MWKPLGIITGLEKESGLLDTQPLYDTLEAFLNIYGEEFKRSVAFGTVDANTGSYVVHTEKDLHTLEDKLKAVVSSASIPFAFPAQQWNVSG